MRRVSRPQLRPSSHLVVIGGLFLFLLVGLVAIDWASQLRGYEASRLVAGRDLAFILLTAVAFLWLMRRQRYRGQLLVFTSAILLFSIGLLMQFRLFSDPEYGARGGEKGVQRRNKGAAVQMLNVATEYDEAKRSFLFGPGGKVPSDSKQEQTASSYGLRDLVTSPNTYVPIGALITAALCFLLFRRDNALLWMQRHSLITGLLTLIPFSMMALASEEGKFLGQTTPWEAVKVLFLLSFAGLLTDTYQHLRRTRWGLPPLRYFFPLVLIAAMPVIPFFALADFGQMLVFFGVYVMLYFVAVRKKAQLVYAIGLVAMLFVVFYATASVGSGAGIPRRVYFRFYQWAHTWEPPSPDTWWWKGDYERYLRAKHLNPAPDDTAEIRQRNSEAWTDRVLQQSQGLFGVNEGSLLGRGLGLGFPETVPVSDSDFIYAAVSEETGLAGSAIILLGLAVLVLAASSIAMASRDMFTKLLAAGMSGFLGLQAVVNTGGVLRLLPMTGITFPFVSHGGWSLITSFAMLGILMAISHRNSSLQCPSLPQRSTN